MLQHPRSEPLAQAKACGSGVLLFLLAAVGCAGSGPKLFPKAPQWETPRAGGMVDRAFDTDGDGRTDYVERQAPDGMVALLRYDADGDGKFELETPPPALAGTNLRHLIIILDSVPFDLVRRVREAGRFRLFYPPSRVISPFPVMTDLSLAEFFGVSPTMGVESQYFDGRRLNTGYGTYARETISTWHEKVDYHLPYSCHGLAYSRPEAWYGHELKHIGRLFAKRGEGGFIGYVVGTSALGAFHGDEGHVAGLVQLDRFCQRLIHRNHGRVHITLLSDHGHADVPSRWLDLRGTLRRFGYRVRDKLNGPRDVVVPAFGVVTCAVIHTKVPERVATDLSGVEGIGLAAYVDDSDEVVVLSRDGRARISHRADRFRYQPDHGDPLRLVPVLEELARRGDVGTDGFVDDRILLNATVDHVYPDVVHRLWRAFHGLIGHTPDVLLSIEDGYFCGSSLMNKMIKLRSVHGNLKRISSSGFVMSTVGRVDEVIRMEDLREALRSLGVPLK